MQVRPDHEVGNASPRVGVSPPRQRGIMSARPAVYSSPAGQRTRATPCTLYEILASSVNSPPVRMISFGYAAARSASFHERVRGEVGRTGVYVVVPWRRAPRIKQATFGRSRWEARDTL